MITEDTRITSKSSTRIDLIFSNCPDIIKSGTIKSSISDHEIVFFIKKKIRLQVKHTTIKARTFRNYNKESFQKDVKDDVSWEKFWEMDDVNDLWETFENIIENMQMSIVL